MDLGIRGRKAIVNGGSVGMGKGAVRALAVEGARLFVSARGADRLVAACRDISEATGAEITPIVADHSTQAGREKILSLCPDPDILVGTCSPPPMTGNYKDVTPQDWMDALAVTLISPVEFIRATVDGMMARGWGRIVNIATGAAKYPAEVRILSGPPRAALANYTVAIAKKAIRHNVTINNILPGMHHTGSIQTRYTAAAERNGTSYDEEVQKFVDEWRIPANRFGDPDDVGAFVAMFCSAQANYVTGQSVIIDGGIGNSTF